MKKLFAILTVSMLCCYLYGCSATVPLANLEQGKSKTRDVENLLGTPLNKSYEKEGTVWEYRFDKTNDTARRQPGQTQPQLILKVKFDDNTYDGYSLSVIQKTVQAPPHRQPTTSRKNNGNRPGIPGRQNPGFKDMDKNNDGKISPQEFPGPVHVFERIDKNNDGFIEEDELPPPPSSSRRQMRR